MAPAPGRTGGGRRASGCFPARWRSFDGQGSGELGTSCVQRSPTAWPSGGWCWIRGDAGSMERSLVWGVWGGEPGEGECTCSGRKKRGEEREGRRKIIEKQVSSWFETEKKEIQFTELIYRTSLPKFPLYSHSRVCAPLEAPEVCEEGMASPGSFALLLHNPAVGHNFKNSMLQQVGTITRWFPEIVNNCQFVWQGVWNFPHFGFAELAFEIPHQNWNRQTEGRGRLQTFFPLSSLGKESCSKGTEVVKKDVRLFLNVFS